MGAKTRCVCIVQFTVVNLHDFILSEDQQI